MNLQLEPEDAFGDFDDQLLFLEPLALFPAGLEEGLTIEGTALPEGCHPDAPRNVLYTITEMYPDLLPYVTKEVLDRSSRLYKLHLTLDNLDYFQDDPIQVWRFTSPDNYSENRTPSENMRFTHLKKKYMK